jgi:hypothetical protein
MNNTSDTPDFPDNPALLCQDLYQPLFRWFLNRIDWMRILKEMSRGI